MEDLYNRAASLDPAQRRLFLERSRAERLLDEHVPEAADPKAMFFIGETPASLTQCWMWQTEQALDGSPLFNIQRSLALDGSLDAAAIEQGIVELIKRHTALRTSFDKTPNGIVQRVYASASIPLEIIDLRQGNPEQVIDDTRHLLLNILETPFDITCMPLLRTHLIIVAPRYHLLALTVHHAICDGWSFELLADELNTIAKAYAKGVSPALNPPGQYFSFSQRERALLRSKRGNDRVNEIVQELAPPLSRLRFPWYSHRSTDEDNIVGQSTFAIGEQQRSSSLRLAQAEGTTLFAVALSAITLFLHSTAFVPDVRIATITSNRTPADRNTIGPFVNPVILRINCCDDPPFVEILRRTRLELRKLQGGDVPFEAIISAYQERYDVASANLSHAFTVWHASQNYRSLGNAQEVHFYPEQASIWADITATNDLAFDFHDSPDMIRVDFSYKTRLFLKPEVARLTDSFLTLWSRAVAAPLVAASVLARDCTLD